MSPEEVVSLLGIAQIRVNRINSGISLDDWFHIIGVKVSYGPTTGLAETFEFFGTAAVTIEGHAILGQPFQEVVRVVKLLHPELEVDAAGFTSRALGFAAYAPFALKSPSDPVESVLVFERGYF